MNFMPSTMAQYCLFDCTIMDRLVRETRHCNVLQDQILTLHVVQTSHRMPLMGCCRVSTMRRSPMMA